MSELKEGDYATMFKIKQDDWIDACQEIDQLKSQLEREQKCVELALAELKSVKRHGGCGDCEMNEQSCQETITKIKSLREGEK